MSINIIRTLISNTKLQLHGRKCRSKNGNGNRESESNARVTKSVIFKSDVHSYMELVPLLLPYFTRHMQNRLFIRQEHFLTSAAYLRR